MKKYFAPGRVNLIGEHIDYNGGNVFPVAINLGTYGEVELNDEKCIKLFSNNFIEAGYFELKLGENYVKTNLWFDYVIGVVDVIQRRGILLKQGFSLVISGDIPNSSGLSSSASLEVLVAFILNDLNDLGLSNIDLALIAKEAENNFVGVNCGIMDQFIIANGVFNKALNLNTSSLVYDIVDCDFLEYQLVVLNSKVSRGLADSAYNERRKQCELGLKIIQRFYDVDSICEITLEDFLKIKDYFDEVVFQRIHHVLSEQSRVLKSVEYLNNGDIINFGKLMFASHESLQKDFAVSCLELDFLVENARNLKAIGARMTGAGFGGCAIALVLKKEVEYFKKELSALYYAKTKLNLEIYEVSIEKGVDKIG